MRTNIKTNKSQPGQQVMASTLLTLTRRRSPDHTIRCVQFSIRALSEMTLSMGACLPNLKFVSLDIFGLLAFNAHNLRGHMTLSTPPLRKNFSGVMTRLPLKACLPNWKFVHVDILELLAFNAQKFTESRDPGRTPFSKKFSGVIKL